MDELAKRFAELAEKYGPNVADAAVQAARVEAYSILAAGGVFAVLAIAAWASSYKLARIAWAAEWDAELLWVPVGLLACLGIGLTAASVWSFVDPWTWTAINHPELYLAKRAFHL